MKIETQNQIRAALRKAKREGRLYGTTDYYMVHDDPLPTIDRKEPSTIWEPVSYFNDVMRTNSCFSEDAFKADYPSSFKFLEFDSDGNAIFSYSLFYGDKRGRLKVTKGGDK